MYGESAHGEGYHYSPPAEPVRAWLHQAGLCPVNETGREGYHHFLVQEGPT